MKINTIKNGISVQRGTTTVELALVLPILFLFVFAALEFGRANMIRHFAQNAAYEGARAAIVPGATSVQAQAVALDILLVAGFQDSTINITPSVIEPDDTEVTVEVSVPFDGNSFIMPFFLAGSNLQASCTLSTEVTDL